MKKWYSAFLAGVLLLSVLAGCGQSSSPAAGGKGGSSELTVYTALEDDQLKAYVDAFKKAHPEIKLNIVRDSTGVIVAKLIAEKDNPQADVVWGTAATELLGAEFQGVLEPYSPKGIERILPEFRDSKEPAHWGGIDAFETAFVVNTKELEKHNLPIPKTYRDLIKPEYKGMIVMPNPSSSGTGFFTVSAWIQLWGEEEAWKYMDKLHENIALYTHSGSKPAKMAAAGEYPIGISFGYRGITEKKKGAPLEVVFPEEGAGWDVEANALVKKKQIKPEAKLFLDWAITDEAMKEYNKNFAIITLSSAGGTIPEGYTKDPKSQLIQNDLSKVAKERPKILAEWDKRFSTKSEPKN
ncbi:putative 2-aminoethylphosphonate ABC transporter substrate-binding protein [Brevibacillus borstelensis]|uniref:putative 2-aminoethylphosphonate ABC transporter substrate-binding protein n=1 Tax=Brevibacillus borstelensis TaxID=45462 RepID=UPI000F08EED0|nr:putative 2-aminoethylphosphonate ABC transporter substrate-binding protein [Brevibacillus borstelensis]MCM3622074.1 putative 2-aminoethylphosphonate ABC transporter substrate-binding protein [Brevibacillus borstelensis]MED1744517.1 putative 2-aminoethylphosphonate ABC transporter substrate-binding protein [Brevibacillus borstelensis]MED1885242.1 putative 2-aminoethylphosphonate ABC transporter substrate-binding protein [Brevibacillus borstelensis]RNB61366.1 putative 2-aminoethylphosphonate A